MSHVVLQRVMVRMLYDPGFAARVLEDPHETLAAAELSEDERRWLLVPDARAWRVDPDRARKSLSALLQEYPASFAVSYRSLRSIDRLEAFFCSERFHRAVDERGLISLEFGGYLREMVEAGAIGDRRVAELASLELAIAGVRARAGRLPPGAASSTIDRQGASMRERLDATQWQLSSDKALHVAHRGTAELHASTYVALTQGALPLTEAVLDLTVGLPDEPIDETATQWLLLELQRDDGPRLKFPVAVVEITEEFHALLHRAIEPHTFDQLVATVTELGAEPDDAPDVIEGLVADATIVRTP